MDWASAQIQSDASLSAASATSRSRKTTSKRQRTGTDAGSSWPSVNSVDEEFDPSSLLDATQMPNLVFQNITIPGLDFSLPTSLDQLPVAMDPLGLDLLGVSQSQPEPSEPSPPDECLSQVMGIPSDLVFDPQPAARPKRRRSSGQSSSLSPFSIDQAMMARSNNQLISTNLLQIYHDVIEHNLSCWLTEVTCPYKTQQRWSPETTATLQREWGPSWSNRIYRRTVKLDRVAQSTRMIQLARSEDSAAQKALHLAIMAFATQWAQGSRRQRQRYSDDLTADLAAEMSDEFDRNLQRHFWDQAQRALQDVSDLESYRVVCAELIFGLTQKPWENDDHPGVVDPAMFSGRGGSHIKTSAMA